MNIALQPELEARVRDPRWVRNDMDEFIRLTSPVATFGRVVTKDTEISGCPINKGERILVRFDSANRDEEIFDAPQEFQVDRQPNRHLAFGMGPHMCLGNILARMELRIFYTQLLPRIESIELAGDPSFLRASFVHGVKHLPIRFKLKPAA